jgi:hypothetical protein
MLFMATGWFLCIVSPAVSSTFTYNLDYTLKGPSPTGTAPWLTASFADAESDQVLLTISAGGLALPPEDNQKIKGLYFNISNESLLGQLAFTPQGGTQAFSWVGQGADAFNADGTRGHDFDIYLAFSTARSDFFGAGETSIYTISATGLNASMFNHTNKDGAGEFFSAAHILSIGSDNKSAFIAAVPIPGAVWMLGAGLIGLVALRRRASK